MFEGKNCLIIDDMCDTGGTICKVAEALHKAGANEIYACFTHGVLSGKAVENITGSYLKKVIVTNTIPIRDNGMPLVEGGKIEVLSVAGLAGFGDQVDSRRDECFVIVYLKVRQVRSVVGSRQPNVRRTEEVMAEKFIVKAEKRETRGKNVNRRLRVDGQDSGRRLRRRFGESCGDCSIEGSRGDPSHGYRC